MKRLRKKTYKKPNVKKEWNDRKGQSTSRIYTIWANMKQRCNNRNHKDFKYYGMKGINLCNEWLDFKVFSEWAYANGYDDNLTIDRIDVNGNYEPSNCQWVDMKTQSYNKSNTVYLTFKGHTRNLKEWEDITGISRKKLYSRWRSGHMSIQDILTKP